MRRGDVIALSNQFPIVVTRGLWDYVEARMIWKAFGTTVRIDLDLMRHVLGRIFTQRIRLDGNFWGFNSRFTSA